LKSNKLHQPNQPKELKKMNAPISRPTADKVPTGARCDDHPDRPAVARIQGETDSFGSELADLCQECLDAYNKYREQAPKVAETCEWCGAVTTDCAHTRDVDEGMAGPVYMVCSACRRKQAERISEEMDALQSEDIPDYGGVVDDRTDGELDIGCDPEIGECEQCKTEAELFPTRYTEEGFFGSPHLICIACRQKQAKQDNEDLEYLDSLDDDSA